MQIIDIERKHLDLVKQILKKTLGKDSDVIVFAFGSRVKGNAKKFSDLDLAIYKKGEKIPQLVGELLYEFEESDLPFKVDVIDLNNISEGFQKAIEKNLVKMEYKKLLPEGWREVRLGECLEIKHGKSQIGIEDIYGKYPILATGGEIGKTNNYLYNKESVLIGRKGTINKPMYIETPFWTIDTLFYSKVKPNSRAKFLYYIFQIINWHIYNEGSTIPSLSASTIMNVKILLPPLSEQIAIAKILSEWDKAIDLVSHKIELKEQLKKGLMQRLLTGKVRLKGFNGEWEKNSLSCLATINKGQQLGKLQMINQRIYPVLNGGINFSGYTNHFNTNENTIAISEGGNSCGFVSYIKQKFWSGGHCYTLSNLKTNSNFLYQLLKLNESSIMNLRVGSGLPNIQKSSLENYLLNIPQDLAEQTAIVEVLTTADDEISLLKKQLELLKLQKKGLMQKLLTGEWSTRNIKLLGDKK